MHHGACFPRVVTRPYVASRTPKPSRRVVPCGNWVQLWGQPCTPCDLSAALCGET
jgi:hypothetical protein